MSRPRHRLAGPHVAELIEALARVAPAAPVRSLRDGTRAHAIHHLDGDGEDRLSAPGRDVDYRLTRAGARKLAHLGIEDADRLPVRYCVDWTEQAHHLSGPLGRALASRLLELGWLRRADRGRAVQVTDAGAEGLRREFGLPRA
jgi:hypothetical protein